MYGWLWRHLPGGRYGRPAVALLLLVAVLALLFLVVFPWVEPRLPFNDSTVGQDEGLHASHAAGLVLTDTTGGRP